MLKTFGKEGKKEKKLAIDNEEFGEIGDVPPGDEAPRGRNKIYIEVKRIIDQKNKEYWSEDKVKTEDEYFSMIGIRQLLQMENMSGGG